MKTESSRETSLKKDHGAKSRHEGTSVGGRGKATHGGIRRTGHGEKGEGGREHSREKKDKMEGDNHRNHEHQAIVKPEDPAGFSRETLYDGCRWVYHTRKKRLGL